jgi:hypothetical protein
MTYNDDMIELAKDVGMKLENNIRIKILSNIPPPNASSTIRSKGSSHTLIDTGEMLESVSHEVDFSDPELLTIKAGVFEEGIAEYACYNEYGTNSTPTRSFIRSTYDEIFDAELMPEIADKLFDITKDKLRK